MHSAPFGIAGVLVVLLTGCEVSTTTSTYDPSPSQKSLDISGNVENTGEFTPMSALFGIAPAYGFSGTAIDSPHQQVAITSFSDTCGNSDVEGQILYLDFFQDPTAADASVSEPASFQVWQPSRGAEVPAGNVVVASYAVTGPEGGSLWLAESGSVEVSDVSEDVLSATVDLDYAHGSLWGSFFALGCQDWMRSSNVPTPPAP